MANVMKKQVSFQISTERWLLLHFISLKTNTPISTLMTDMLEKHAFREWENDPAWLKSRGK